MCDTTDLPVRVLVHSPVFVVVSNTILLIKRQWRENDCVLFLVAVLVLGVHVSERVQNQRCPLPRITRQTRENNHSALNIVRVVVLGNVIRLNRVTFQLKIIL